MEREGLQRVFDSHDRGMSGIWRFIDTMFAVKTSHEDMWHCARESFYADSRQAREVADRQALGRFRNFCAALDSFVKWSTFYRRHYGGRDEPRPRAAPGPNVAPGPDAAPENEDIDQ